MTVEKAGLFRTVIFASTAVIALACASVPAFAQARQFDIPAQSASVAVSALARQADAQILLPGRLARSVRTNAVAGSMTVEEALSRMLTGTGLVARKTDARTWTIVRGEAVRSRPPVANRTKAPPVGETKAGSAAADDESASAGDAATPEILIIGRRTMNIDIRRTRDDSQPYVTFDSEVIERSQASSVEDFLKTRLPMNTVQTTAGQTAVNQNGNISQINLRGLGANQTLVLIDGRRMPGVASGGLAAQPDINAIPVSAIERIESLPGTASGIYGGGATGGVVNVITKKNYDGLAISGSYGNTTRGDNQTYRIDASLGLALQDGRMHVIVAGSHMDTNGLHVGDRNFAAKGRALLLANNPSAIFSLAAPPMGYTNNIRSTNGSNLVLKTGATLNSPNTFVPVNYAGPASDGGAALVANAGKYNLDIPDDLSGAKQSLIKDTTVDSFFANVRQEIGSRVEAFADVFYLSNKSSGDWAFITPASVTLPVNAPNNPFTTPINISVTAPNLPDYHLVTRSRSFRATGGVIVRLPRNWTASADYVWGRSTYRWMRQNPALGDPDGTGPGASAATALSNGTINLLRDLNASPADFSPYLLPYPSQSFAPGRLTLHDASARLSGPLFRVPGGPVILSGLVENRKDSLSDTFQNSTSAAGVKSVSYVPGRSQEVMSYYAEARAPIVSPANDLPFLRALEFQASVRHDSYKTRVPSPTTFALATSQPPLPIPAVLENKVSATKYTLALRYEPVAGLAFRASHGTGFLPPDTSQLTPAAPQAVSSAIADPKRGNASVVTSFLFTQGGNPNLTPEQSDSWSFGAVLTPQFLEGFRLSVDYVRIHKNDEIVSLLVSDALALEDSLPGRVTRAPLTAADAALGYTGGLITAIDTTFTNVARTHVNAYDFQADYAWTTERLGDFGVHLIATWAPQFKRQTFSNLAYVDSAGFAGGPLEWRGNAGIDWRKGPVSLGWSAQYYDSYFVYAGGSTAAAIAGAVLSQGSAKIPSQIYHDIFAVYRFADSARFGTGPLKGTEISFGIQNLFDKRPPIIAGASPVGGYSTYGDARLRRFTLSVRQAF